MQEISRPRNQDAANLFDNCRGSSTNRPLFMHNKANFSEAQMNASSVFTKDYENESAFRGRQSKAKQSQFVFLTAENTEYAEKNNICVSDCPIEKYALYPISPCSLRTRRLMKNKANCEPC